MQLLTAGREVNQIKWRDAVNFLRKDTQGRIFSVYFQKKDGIMREMTCRLGVKAHLSGGDLPYDPEKMLLLPVFDMHLKEYRMVNFKTLVSFNIDGETFILV